MLSPLVPPSLALLSLPSPLLLAPQPPPLPLPLRALSPLSSPHLLPPLPHQLPHVEVSMLRRLLSS